MVDPKEALDKLADRVLAYRPMKVKGSLLRKVGRPKGRNPKGKKKR